MLDALAPIAPHAAVETRIEDGTAVVTVAVPPGTDPAAVDAVLGRYVITWELAVGRR